LNNVGVGTKDSEIKIDDEDDDEQQDSLRGYNCTNSTKQTILPYWSFVFSDVNLRDYVCIQMNIPSGLCTPEGGLADKVEATVSTCKTRLIVVMEWPETLTTCRCMEDALSGTWTTSTGSTFNMHSTSGSTVGNMVQAFKKELHKIRLQNKVGMKSLLGSKCTIDLPFQVESDMVVCQPNMEQEIGSVNLYIVLKKQCKKSEVYEENKMKVRMSNALSYEKQISNQNYSRERTPRSMHLQAKNNLYQDTNNYYTDDNSNGGYGLPTFDEVNNQNNHQPPKKRRYK
jgi:hypothetical protein